VAYRSGTPWEGNGAALAIGSKFWICLAIRRSQSAATVKIRVIVVKTTDSLAVLALWLL